MSSSVIRLESDPFRRYWWVFFLLILGVAGLSSWPFVKEAMRNSGVDDKQLTAKEQSLSVLDGSSQNAASSAGKTLPEQTASAASPAGSAEETGPYAHKTKDIYDPASALYQSPSTGAQAPGSPVGPGSAQASGGATSGKDGGSGDNLAAALANVANAGKKPQEGARGVNNSYTSQSSFSAPHANFGSLNGLGNGAASSPASYSAAATPFGIGKSNPVIVAAAGGTGPVSPGAFRSRPGSIQAMDELQNASAQANQGAWSANPDVAAGMSGRSYDLSGVKPTLNSNTPHSGVTMGDGGVVGNLKQNDPTLDKKDIQPPVPANVGAVDNGNSQIMGMILQVAIGGLLGPMLFGGAAAAGGGGLLGSILHLGGGS